MEEEQIRIEIQIGKEAPLTILVANNYMEGMPDIDITRGNISVLNHKELKGKIKKLEAERKKLREILHEKKQTINWIKDTLYSDDVIDKKYQL